MDVQILAPGDARWDAALASAPHDFYALPGFVALCGRQNNGRPVAVLAERGSHRLLIPLLLRPVPELGLSDTSDRLDAASPYGYPGVVVSPDGLEDDRFLDDALDAVLVALGQAGVVSVFLRLHPLISGAADALRRHGIVVDHGQTVSIDLRQDEDAILAGMRRSYAKHLRKLDRMGFRTEVDEACRPETIDVFVDVYTETMDRVGAARSYYVDTAYVRNLQEAVGGQLAISLVRNGDEVAVAGIFTTVNGIVQDYLGGTRTAYLSQAPARQEIWEVTRWARERGHHRYHLGGGVGGQEDSLFAFKAGFSPDRHLFQTARLIVDPEAARELTDGWSRQSGIPAAGPDAFFPAWRAPVPGALTLR